MDGLRWSHVSMGSLRVWEIVMLMAEKTKGAVGGKISVPERSATLSTPLVQRELALVSKKQARMEEQGLEPGDGRQLGATGYGSGHGQEVLKKEEANLEGNMAELHKENDDLVGKVVKDEAIMDDK
ncbi:hypothetical protein VNO78_02942 [Psophocarpus tetragonolobus]|uniref:Uncharacterized protein n=1 Tax=Psophocarpus tetragonolobus TaxID=3891 RepID=A0AAN9T3F4_PSOTE